MFIGLVSRRWLDRSNETARHWQSLGYLWGYTIDMQGDIPPIYHTYSICKALNNWRCGFKNDGSVPEMVLEKNTKQNDTKCHRSKIDSFPSSKILTFGKIHILIMSRKPWENFIANLTGIIAELGHWDLSRFKPLTIITCDIYTHITYM